MSARIEWGDLPTGAPGRAVIIALKDGGDRLIGYAWKGRYFNFPNVEMREHLPEVNIISNVNISVDAIESITPIRGYDGFMEELT